ncbi:MAG TPA: hypothetical protein VKE94_20140 [Gemmataceae bacterium]|nr:hypothetical protein [Gemmataceae bacterium]
MHSLFPRLSAVVGMALVAGFLLVPLDAAAKPKKHNHDEASIVLRAASVSGQVQGGGTFAGALDLTRLALDANQLVGAGTLTGTVTDASGTSQSVTQDVELPVQLTGCQPFSLAFLAPVELDTDRSDPLVDLASGASANLVAASGVDPNAVSLLGILLCQVPTLQTSPNLLDEVLGLVNDLL